MEDPKDVMPNVTVTQNANKPANPLAGYYRQPKIYIMLPSKGQWYPEGTLDKSEDGQYPVYAMTAADELMYKTPDALMNGNATTEVIKSCVPAIKEPWTMPTLDVDACLVAIRIATYGEKMEVNTVCPKCNEEQKYDYQLTEHLEKLAQFNYNDKVQIGELVFHLKPYSYKEITSKQIQQIEQQKIFDIVSNDDMSEEEKIDKFGASFIKLTKLTVDVVTDSIKAIESPQGITDDRQHIADFMKNTDKSIFQAISDHLNVNKRALDLEARKVKCGDCSHEFNVTITMDQANFFAVRS